MSICRAYYYICILFLCVSCQPDRLDTALELAGENRAELEKVLAHYKNDKTKCQAARFLIENMPGHRGVDTVAAVRLQPVYDKHVAFSEQYHWERSEEWKHAVNDLWKREQTGLYIPSRPDLETVNADWLIREIDRAFQAWQENAFTRGDSFEDFCYYVLPYRYADGICMDEARETFYQRHAHLFADPARDFRQLIDSLHEAYSCLMHADWAASSMPFYRAKAFEYVKRGSCDDKAWYNCLQLSALGMGVAIDFVPAWGNRSGGHSWNCVLVHGEAYPFEPFWDADRWKYKRIYNNEDFDLLWGRFQLPKVYRHTYEWHLEGPMADADEARENIPPLFLNPFIKDVSHEYFQATDVEVHVNPTGHRYAYLCVFGSRQWNPVQWGRVQPDGKVTFKGMGRDIVYWPMFCEGGEMVPAAPAFLLDRDGKQVEIACQDEIQSITVSAYTYYLYPEEIAETKRTLVGACIRGSNDPDFAHADTLVCLTDSMESWGNEIRFDVPQTYRYFRLDVPKDSLNLCEISFFETEEMPVQPIKQETNLESLSDDETPERMIDGLSATGWRGKAQGKGFVCWDLGKVHAIQKIRYVPYYSPYLPADRDIPLCYWDNGWKEAGRQRWEKGTLTFPNVPKGTVYRLRIQGVDDRIFRYENGWIKWY